MTRTSLIIILACFFGSCHSQGHRGTSSSIEEAKKREVFVKEYYTVPNPVIINDTIQFKVIEAWLEYKWRHSNNKKKTAKYNEFQIRINSLKELPKRFNFAWSIGRNFDFSLRSCNKDCLIGDFKELPPDTLVYPVQKGEVLINGSKDEDIIGKFTLIAK